MTVKDTADKVSAYAGEKLTAAGDKLHDAGTYVRDAAGSARAGASDGAAAARDKAADVYDAAVDRTAAAYDAAREKASAAYASARETAGTARQRASDGLEQSPIAAVLGGVAIGILIGALLPRSQRETEALAPVGDKLAALARNALTAAKDAGQEKLDELGINKGAAREQVGKLVEGAQQAVSSAGSAAAGSLRQDQ